METFVVRVFATADGEQVELIGIVEHSASGRAAHFRGPQGLLEVVRHQLDLANARSDPPTAKEEGCDSHSQ